MNMAPGPDSGAQPGSLVVSLDFELHWGVRDVYPADGSYTEALIGAREAVRRLLDLFEAYGIGATWATVGFLFAESREELMAFHPDRRPAYEDSRLDPYAEPVGESEADDPIHFAPSLIRRIRDTPGQEVATHTYSHYYALEAGADLESFRQDTQSARAIAEARGVKVQSLVLPRNQWTPSCAFVLKESGIKCYRGNQQGWMYRAEPLRSERWWKRAARLVDAHLPATRWEGTPWTDFVRDGEPRNVPATCFLRPVGSGSRRGNERRIERIRQALTTAAERGRVIHLWWHPHNFGSQTTENLDALRVLLEHVARLQSEHGMQSLTMAEAAVWYATEPVGIKANSGA